MLAPAPDHVSKRPEHPNTLQAAIRLPLDADPPRITSCFRLRSVAPPRRPRRARRSPRPRAAPPSPGPSRPCLGPRGGTWRQRPARGSGAVPSSARSPGAHRDPCSALPRSSPSDHTCQRSPRGPTGHRPPPSTKRPCAQGQPPWPSAARRDAPRSRGGPPPARALSPPRPRAAGAGGSCRARRAGRLRGCPRGWARGGGARRSMRLPRARLRRRFGAIC
ncbi:hypothetical protein DFJ74DRAFT_51436 [Hyaloraphidium curvatum]|nr:hypothetical protein DFJ74DRAFT_51436 [Hyaloraphidium curvatum]